MIVRALSIPLLLLPLHVAHSIGVGDLLDRNYRVDFGEVLDRLFDFGDFGVLVDLRVSGQGTKDYIDHDWKLTLVRLSLSEDGKECWGRNATDPFGIFRWTRRDWLVEITAKNFSDHGYSVTFISPRWPLHPWKKGVKKYLIVNKGYFRSSGSFELTNSSLFTGTAGPNTIKAFGLTVQVNISCKPGFHGDSCERGCEPATGLHICDVYERRFVSCATRCKDRFSGICVDGPPDYCGFATETIHLLIENYPKRLYGSEVNVPSPLPYRVRNLMDRARVKYPIDARVAKADWKAYRKLPWPTADPADTVDASSSHAVQTEGSGDGAK